MEKLALGTSKLALATSKGGAGKTATVRSLAAALEAMGLRVLILDADKNQNALAWVEKRQQTQETTIEGRAVEGPNAVPKIRTDCDVVIVDTAGVEDGISAKLTAWADLFIVPTLNDEDSANEALDTFEMLRDYDAEARILRIYDAREKAENADIDELLKAENAPVFATVLRKTSAIKKLAKNGQAPTDIKTRSFFGRSEGDDARSDLAALIKEMGI